MDFEKRRLAIAVFLAAIFHSIGLIGLLLFPESGMVSLTPVNFLVSLVLLLWLAHEPMFLGLAALVYLTGFVVEVIGVNTALLFGEYRYGPALGWSWLGVPLLIGVNWLVVILGNSWWVRAWFPQGAEKQIKMDLLAAALGASMATAFDWLLEPVAIRLGYWEWIKGEIPMLNYLTWWCVSFLLLLVIIRFLPFRKVHAYSGYLLVIQILFFIALRLFLN